MSRDWIAVIDDTIRSASLGPPSSAFNASAVRPLFCGGPDEGSFDVVVEFSTPHFRSELSPGSMMMMVGSSCGDCNYCKLPLLLELQLLICVFVCVVKVKSEFLGA